MSKVKVTQVRSSIGQPKAQKRTLEALGLRRIGQMREHETNAAVQGMLDKVRHLVTIEEK